MTKINYDYNQRFCAQYPGELGGLNEFINSLKSNKIDNERTAEV